MTQFLLFTIYAPLTSWGDISVGEVRGSWDRPSRSAVLGLVAAALGIRRDEQARHDALDRAIGCAIRLDAAGVRSVDFHTAQSVPDSDIRRALGRSRPATRKSMLEVGELQTIVSRRELLQDALATVALWNASSESSWPLDEIKRALERPVFALYAGRKANVLGLPLAATLIDAKSLAHAFHQRPPGMPCLDSGLVQGHRPEWGREVAYDGLPAGVESGLVEVRKYVRRDTHPHRERWHFGERVVTVGLLPEQVLP